MFRRIFWNIRSRIRFALLIWGREINGEIERMKEEKRREWIERGYPERLVFMALNMAKGWAARMVEFATRDLPPDMREEVVVKLAPMMFKRALKEVAEPWLETMAGA